MKKNNELLYIFLLFICLSYLFFNTSKLYDSIIYSTKLWFNKVFSFLFIMIIINELLINNNIIYYINKIFKKNGIKYYVLLMSILSGSPTSTCLIKELYQNKTISLEDANKLLYFAHFSNPIFLISVLRFLFDTKTAIILLLCHYIPNIVMCFIIKVKSNNQNSKVIKKSFNTILNNAINTSLLVLGTLSLYILLSNIIIDLFNIRSINSAVLKGIIEITQGLYDIPKLLINNHYKALLAILFLNFGGISIHSQIKSIISDTFISYKYFFIGRLISIIVSLCFASISSYL